MDMILVLFATAAGLALLERVPRWRARPQRLVRAHAASDLVYLATGWVAGASLALAYVEHGSRLLGALGVPRWSGRAVPLWITVPFALVLIDAGNYAAHWLLHRVDAFWQLHKVHHSSRQLDWLATFRSHILEQFLRRVLAPALLIATGMPIAAVALAGAVFTAWAIVNHANLRFGPAWLELLFITPRLHRMHHDIATTERNLGTVLTLWDRWRGTFISAEPARHAFGVPGAADTYPQDWLAQLIAPFGQPSRRHSAARRRAARIAAISSRGTATSAGVSASANAALPRRTASS
jgi:sterol desaturase/sphingolipid hydroxylase (fatty acid hydroxylase superfamily)